MTIKPGLDLRLPEHRRDVFLAFYDAHLRWRAHPGCVYYLFPALAEANGWTDEELLWFAFLNGNTQNPITSLLLHRAGPTPARAADVVDYWRTNYRRLAFDTDRRHHKKALDVAVGSYLSLTGGNQLRFWRGAARGGWGGMWRAATSIHSFGRLSAWSYIEYLSLAGIEFEPETLMLDDRSGSKSHRNGLAKVCGLDAYDWHASNPTFDGRYPPDLLEHFDREAHFLLADARATAAGKTYLPHVNLLTLESALCTYKSWHRPRRRYANVYNDMLHDRIVAAQAAWPEADLDVFWQARRDWLAPYLRLEDNPGDPGVHHLKQDHYRLTGQAPVLGREDPRFWSDFDTAVDAGTLGRFR